MPTKHVTSDVMSPGGKDGGKHWTKSEIESRKIAEGMTKRKTRVNLRAPEWLSEDGLAVWKRVKKKAAGLDLFDNLDAEVLAMYCDAVVQYQDAQKDLKTTHYELPVDRNQAVRNVQAWARLTLQYAEKLGFTPTGRARLIKRRADEIADDKFGNEFD